MPRSTEASTASTSGPVVKEPDLTPIPNESMTLTEGPDQEEPADNSDPDKVTIHTGSLAKTPYMIDKSLLCNESTYFEQLFQNNETLGKEPIHPEKMDEKGIDLIMRWFVDQPLTGRELYDGHTGLAFEEWCHLWESAGQLGILKLQKQVLDAIEARNRVEKQLPNRSAVEYAGKVKEKGVDDLWVLFVRLFAHALPKPEERDPVEDLQVVEFEESVMDLRMKERKKANRTIAMSSLNMPGNWANWGGVGLNMNDENRSRTEKLDEGSSNLSD